MILNLIFRASARPTIALDLLGAFASWRDDNVFRAFTFFPVPSVLAGRGLERSLVLCEINRF